MKDTSINRTIAARRILIGMKRKHLAEHSGLSYPYICEIENGKKLPSTRSLDLIARALGWSLSELLDAARVTAEAGELPEGPERRSAPALDGPTLSDVMAELRALRRLVDELAARV